MMSIEERPWGTYRIIEQGTFFKIKQIILLPHKRTSLQYHKYRAECMTVTDGSVEIVVGNETNKMVPGDYCYIKTGVPHRLQNNSEHPVYIIEVQTGENLGEDDIIRLEDDFNRDAIHK